MLTIVAAAGAALVLAACGGGEDNSSGGTTPAGVDVEVIAVDGIAWNASTYNAEAGEITIFSRNASSLPHNLHIQNTNGDAAVKEFIDLPSRGADGSITVTLEPGDYRIVCLIPGHQNMNALLRVA